MIVKLFPFVIELSLLTTILAGCGFPNPVVPGEEQSPSIATASLKTQSPGSEEFLFADTDESRNLPSEAHIVRYRFVKVRLEKLLDDSGQPRNVKRISINLFPDVIYTAVIEEVTQEGDSFTWSGYLEGVETSYFTMVYTSGVFMGHYASPNGVYEVVFVEGDLYRVIMIDQTNFQGGEG